MKFRITKEAYDKLSDDQKALYKINDDGATYQLKDVEGAVSREQLDEFRTNNIELTKKVEELTKQFAGVDMTKYTAMLETERKIAEKKLLDAGKIDELVTERIAAAQKKFDEEKATLTKANGDLTSNLERLIIDNGITAAAAALGVRKTAIEDVVARGRGVFKVVDNKAVPYKGDQVMYGEDARTPLSIEGWLTDLTKSAPHLFEASSGGGSGDHQRKSGQQGGSTMTRADFNKLPSAQQRTISLEGKVAIVD